MSGGVDSSVAAALLVRLGYEVTGMMMRLWSEPGKEGSNRCCTPDAMAMARRVAAQLGIPFYAIDAKEVFHQQVVSFFIDGYTRGITPNPCIECNRHIRWEFLLDQALSSGADFLATGHYARLDRDELGRIQIRRAVDAAKDQSYVLHVLGQGQLAHALFPLGGFTKPQVRQMAREFGLPVAERADSQDLCFLAASRLPDFLMRNAPGISRPGPILDTSGKQLGEHQGLAFYTIGQRKGLRISSPEPLYVLSKDSARNALIVGLKEELGQNELAATGVHWVSGAAPKEAFRAQVKIRYKAQDAWGTVTPVSQGSVQIHFDEPMRDITPGQSAVFYREDVLLGGGIIQSAK